MTKPTEETREGVTVLSERQQQVLDYITGDETLLEREPVQRLAEDGQLIGYRHYGFWSCMDTLKEKNYLEELWRSGKAPWVVWG